MAKGPVLIDLGDEQLPSVAEAPAVPDTEVRPQGQAMQSVARLVARRPSRLVRWFWGLLVALIGAVVSVSAWDFVVSLLDRWPYVGMAVSVLGGVFILVALCLGLRELAALGRLKRIDGLRHDANEAASSRDLQAARKVVDRLDRLYAPRDDTKWARDRLADLRGDQLDADGLLGLAEQELLGLSPSRRR